MQDSSSLSLVKQETETGYGIMEEPDLTLLSTSDISITETDLANLTIEDNEAQCSQAGAVQPSSSMETTFCGAASEPWADQPTVASSGTSLISLIQHPLMLR